MPKFQVVTDSCAHFGLKRPPANVTVVPYTLMIDGRPYREGIDLTDREAMQLMSQAQSPVQLVPPTVKAYSDVFEQLAAECDGIISIHASMELTQSLAHARTAAQPYTGRCRVIPLDSKNISVAQAMLVALAAREASKQPTLDDLVRLARGAAENVYAVYTVDQLTSLLQQRILAPSHTLLGAMLNIKPVLSMEHGRLVAIEKVRTRAQALDRLVEFVVEFTDLVDAAIIHPFGATEAGRALAERLTLEYPEHAFDYRHFGPSLAALIGTDAVGLAVMENPFARIDEHVY